MRKMSLPSSLALPFIALMIGACAPAAQLPLQRVVLYQNGLGYFERAGRLRGDKLRLRLRAGEVDDILKSLTVLGAGEHTTLGTVAALRPRGKEGAHDLELALPPGASHELRVTYAAPTPVWRAAYRVVLYDKAQEALLQGWAIVANPSDEDWREVHLTLATGAPLSFAVDLHTPQFVERPDATGRFVRSVAEGVVGSESAAPSRGAIADRDGDRIADDVDQCPGEPEAYNGFEDDDGCPDRGRVVIRKSNIEILDKVYFRSNDAGLQPISLPIVDAIAATLKGNPQITLMEVQGHTASNEPEPMGLASRRARAIKTYLIGKGIASERLNAQAYGATRPVRAGSNEAAHSFNRRVEFLILRRSDSAAGEDEQAQRDQQRSTSTVPRPTLSALERSMTSAPATRVDVAGMSRYELASRVSIPHGTSGMIAILNQRVAGEEVYLYRPDAAAPGSELHPFRAARLESPPGTTLEPGPVALYARDTFVGDAILDRLHAGETTFLPFALDSSTVVRVENAEASSPIRLVAIARGVATVEDRAIHKTTYAVRAGIAPPRRIFIRHERRSGYELATPPAGTQETPTGLLMPLALKAQDTATLVLEERQPTRREVRLLEPGNVDLRAYAVGMVLPAKLRTQLDEVIALRGELSALEIKEGALRSRVNDAAERQAQLRESLLAIAKNPRAEALRKELLGRLTEAVRGGDALSLELARVSSAQAESRARLEARVADLTIEP